VGFLGSDSRTAGHPSLSSHTILSTRNLLAPLKERISQAWRGLQWSISHAVTCWSIGVVEQRSDEIKGLIQTELMILSFSNTLILQYSNTPRALAIFFDKAIKTHPSLEGQVFSEN
jgi:hypothetical protein